MYRVLESHRVQFAIDRALRDTFRRELLAVALPAGGALALVRVRTVRTQATRGAVLLVHGFGMNRHTWHLDARSFVGFLAHLGFDVYVLELRGVGRSRSLGSHVARRLDEYIEEDLPLALAAVIAHSSHSRCFIIAHSMGGLVTYAALADIEHQLAGVVALSAVFTFAGESRFLQALSHLGRALRLPERFRGQPFAVRQIGHMLSKYLHLIDSPASLGVMPVHAWYPGSMERDLLRRQIRVGWDLSSLGILVALLRVGRAGELVSRSGRRYLDHMPAVDVPLLVAAAELDSLLPPVDARVAFERSRSTDKRFVVFGPSYGHPPFGHLDMILGRNAPLDVWPVIGRWLCDRTTL